MLNIDLTKENCEKMVNLVSDIICISNLAGYAQYVNSAIETILGYSTTEFEEYTLLDLIHPEDRNLLDGLVKEISENKYDISSFEYRFRCKDGTYRWISWNIRIVWDEQLIYSDGRDITERKKVEEELKKATKKLHHAQEFSKVGYWEAKLTCDEYIWSNELFHIFGYKPQEFKPSFEHFLSMVHPDDRNLVINASLNISHKSKVSEIDFRVIRADKKVIWVYEKIIYEYDDKGKLVEKYGITQDITERKIKEARLRESENKYKELVENVPVGIITFDTAGNITFANQKVLEIVGSPSEEEFMSINLLTDPVLMDGGISEFYGDCIEQKKLLTIEKEVYSNWGKSTTIRIQAAPISDDSGNIHSVIAIIEDFTERKKLENELKTAKEEAEASNKAKSQFLANMSHEIRTPMNGIMGMTDLMLMSSLTVEQTEMAEIIKASSKSLLKIINDILDLSKIDAGKVELNPELIDFHNFINSKTRIYETLAQEKGLDFEMKTEANLPKEIIVDRTKLAQIANNLVGNAVKFTEKDKIIVSIEKVKTIENKVMLGFSISDTGIGIKMEDMHKLFNYFTQLEDFLTKRFQGTGLGLAISKSLVELMGGEIFVESEYGKGSTFYFTCLVEVPEEINTDSVDEHSEADKHEDGHLLILLVEDDPVGQMFIKKACKLKGWRVYAVNGGKEALDTLQKHRFNLILMDVQMSGMSGYDVTKIIREKEISTGTHIPIIAATAYAMEEDRVRCLEAGMDDYISKPISIDKLYELVEKWGTPK
jgi:PAS domain S-box-containing protein